MSTTSEKAIELIRQARHVVAFTGAGISTEAGIPDFRSEGGLWEDEALLAQLSADGFLRDPAGFYRSAARMLAPMLAAEPTPAHHLLRQLEKRGKVVEVVTQNIDGLHQAAGSQIVYEVHGTYRTGRCVGCGARHAMADFYAQLAREEILLPQCAKCAAAIKPDIVLFGDLLPTSEWRAAMEAARACDLVLVLGSSLVVYPAADLPMIAVDAGAKLVIVNLEPTELDDRATAVVRGSLGEFARDALAALA